MQAFDPKPIEDFSKAAEIFKNELTAEERIANIAGNVYFYQCVAIFLSVVWAICVNNPILNMVLPMAVLTIVGITHLATSAIKMKVWESRRQAEAHYFECSKAVYTQSHDKLMELVALGEFAQQVERDAAAGFDHRSIN